MWLLVEGLRWSSLAREDVWYCLSPRSSYFDWEYVGLGVLKNEYRLDLRDHCGLEKINIVASLPFFPSLEITSSPDCINVIPSGWMS